MFWFLGYSHNTAPALSEKNQLVVPAVPLKCLTFGDHAFVAAGPTVNEVFQTTAVANFFSVSILNLTSLVGINLQTSDAV
jgi:hypothetical protein